LLFSFQIEFLELTCRGNLFEFSPSDAPAKTHKAVSAG
jgi:hypothetical protein